MWAEPDVGSLAQQLRRVYEDRQEALRRATVARERVLSYFCSPSRIESYRRELRRIAQA